MLPVKNGYRPLSINVLANAPIAVIYPFKMLVSVLVPVPVPILRYECDPAATFHRISGRVHSNSLKSISLIMSLSCSGVVILGENMAQIVLCMGKNHLVNI